MNLFLPYACSLALLLSIAPPSYPEEAFSHKALFGPNTDFPYFEASSLPDAPDPQQFNLQVAQFLAEASMLAYVMEEAFIESALQKAGFPETRFFVEKGTFAVLAIRDDALVLIFRGSETANKADYTTDAKIAQTPFGEFGDAHFGFVEALEWVCLAIDKEITSILQERDRPLWVTGHSLGGALATLYGIHNNDCVSAIYPIGSPRVGGIRFVQNTQDLVNVYRIVNDNDIIPRLPTPPFYKHLGPLYFLTSNGELIEDPPFARKWESRRQGHVELIETLYNDHWKKGDFRTVPTAYVVDHSPRLYVEALANLTNESVHLNQTDESKLED